MNIEQEDRESGERWIAAMLRGDFEGAWQESDRLRSRGAADPHRFWDGRDVRAKRVIVRCLHGFGDAVQMMRYAPMLAARAQSVVWEVAPGLVELAQCFEGIEEVVTWGKGAPALAPVWDSQIEVMELPYLFRTVVQDLPVAELYCRVPLEAARRARACMGPGPRVGVVWAGGEWDPGRSIPFAALEPLLALGEMWSLQGGEAHREGVAAGLRDARAACGDGLISLAAAIAEMDLVITVDTLAAHLAGALRRPVWVMLQREADWRWQSEGERSAWYPSMRLFRQMRQGDWASVVEQICQEMT